MTDRVTFKYVMTMLGDPSVNTGPNYMIQWVIPLIFFMRYHLIDQIFIQGL